MQGGEDVEDYKCRVWKITSAGCGRCRRLQVQGVEDVEDYKCCMETIVVSENSSLGYFYIC